MEIGRQKPKQRSLLQCHTFMTMGVIREKGSGGVTLDEPFLVIQ